MTIILSANTNQNSISSQTSAVQQAESATSAINTTSDQTADDDLEKQSTVEISTRAHKIQKLNEEFFSGGPGAVKITSELINRLEEYELITTEEAESLKGLSEFNNPSSNTASSATIAELSAFIISFTNTVKEVDPNNSIIDIMQKAQMVLDNFNDPTESSLSINIPLINKQLQGYIDTSSTQLPDSDQQLLDQLVSAPTNAQALTPGTNYTIEINQ